MTVPPQEGPDVERLLEETLWAPRFEYDTPRFLPGPRKRLARARWRIARWLGDLLHERRLETSGVATEVDHLHPDRVWYQPSGWTYLRRVLPEREVGPGDVFVDLGSGKGRVVLQAARYPFARVIGVEISASLTEVARRNVERARDSLRCRDVELVTADVADWEIPDDVTVVYLYYPFVGDTFRRVMANVVASLDRRPRRFRIVYALPTMEEAVLETGRFRLVRSVGILDSGIRHRIAVYESNPP